MITLIFGISICFMLVTMLLYRFCSIPSSCSNKNYSFFFILAILFLSVYLHLFLALLTPRGDSEYFATVMTKLTEEDFFGFYSRMGITYPPLFNYIFYFLGKLLQFLNIPFDWTLRSFVFCIKLPGILCEFFMAYLIYGIAKKYLSDKQQVFTLFLILLNPGYLFITSYISQVDAWYTTFMLLTVYLILKQKLIPSYFCFAAGILLKFQTLFITPVLIVAIIWQVILHNFSWKRFFIHLFSGLSAILLMGLSYLPFIYDFETNTVSDGGIFGNFTSSIASYGKASQNAYNLWTLLGLNQVVATTKIGPFSCNTWGTIFIVLIVCLSFYFFFKGKNKLHLYPMLAGFLVSGTYCLSVKMMARYLYPAIIFFILAYAMKPTLHRFLCAVSFSIAFFLVTGFDYMVYPWNVYHQGLILPYVISAYVLICFCYLIYIMWTETKNISSSSKQ